MVAPMQGLTEAEWRHVHFRMFGNEECVVEYFTPFIRVERGEVRARDLRDFTSVLNEGMRITPQIIFRDVAEWRLLVDTLVGAGARTIDMNLGCPFVPQVRKGRGAGFLAYPDRLMQIAEAMGSYYDVVEFSVKMRLGVRQADEVKALTGILNDMPLRHVTVHPRTADQQYKGELRMEEMDEFATCLNHDVIFNGLISTPEQLRDLSARFSGAMVGRGLLERPSLFAEFIAGSELPVEVRGKLWLEMIGSTSELFSGRLCGTSQIRDKMKPYWDYAPSTLDRKIVKAGRKTGLIIEK
ncbi:MAG: tRNA-dihydrouridine synthase family protein [Duncaniella sp.]|nr:tRNA-dihydrouridine synthase family protein [Duncaniella sp.]